MPTEILRPNGPGDLSAFSVSGAASNWQAVDDVTANGDTDYVYLSSGTGVETYALTDTALTTETINQVNAVGVFQRAGALGFCNPGLRLSGINDSAWAASTNAGTTYALIRRSNISRPGGGSWQVSDLNSLQAGANLNAQFGEIRCTQIFVEVVWAEGGGAPEIDDVDPDTFAHGDTGIDITGSNFGATQGTGSVILSPTDDVEDAGAVTQTVTSWSDTGITFTAVGTGLDGGTVYVFVINDDGDSNEDGFPVTYIDARSGSGSESAASEVNADGQKSTQDTSTITAENAVDATGAPARSASAAEALEAAPEAAGQASRVSTGSIDSSAGTDASGSHSASEGAAIEAGADVSAETSRESSASSALGLEVMVASAGEKSLSDSSSIAAESAVEVAGEAGRSDATTIDAESETQATGQASRQDSGAIAAEVSPASAGAGAHTGASSLEAASETEATAAANHTGEAAIDALAGLEASGAGGKRDSAALGLESSVVASGFKSTTASVDIETNAGVNAAGVPVSGSAASITTDAEVSATGVKGSRDSAIIAAISTIDYAATTAREGPARRRNWIINGGFETDTDGWGPLGTSSTIQRNTSDRVSGVASGEVTAGAPGANNRGVTIPIELKEGDEWTFQAWIKGKGNAIGRSISMSMYSSGLGTWRSQSFVLTDEWQFVYISWPSPGSAANIIPLFGYNALEAGEGYLIDNAQLERGLVPTEYIETDGKSETAPGFLELPLSSEVDSAGHAEKSGSSSIGAVSEVELAATHNRLGSAELTLEGDTDPTGEAGHSASISLEIVGSISVEGESTRSDSSSIEVDIGVEAAGEQGQAAIGSAHLTLSGEVEAQGFKGGAGSGNAGAENATTAQGEAEKQGAASVEAQSEAESSGASARSGSSSLAAQEAVDYESNSTRSDGASLALEIAIAIEVEVNTFVSVINFEGREVTEIEMQGRSIGDINLEGRRS